MAGHSKWANTRFRKAAQDQKRGKLFTKLIREISVATKQHGSDPNLNARLRSAIDKALSNNLTRDAIDRAIKRALGNDEKDLNEITYEGYAPFGIAVLIECLTDNHIRTVGNVRHCFNKYGGNLGVDGSTSYLFNKKGQIFIPQKSDVTTPSIEQIMEHAINAGALDLEEQPEGITIITDPKDLLNIKLNLEKIVGSIADAEITMLADNYIKLEEKSAAIKIIDFVEALEDLDDVQQVYTNADLTKFNNEQL